MVAFFISTLALWIKKSGRLSHSAGNADIKGVKISISKVLNFR